MPWAAAQLGGPPLRDLIRPSALVATFLLVAAGLAPLADASETPLPPHVGAIVVDAAGHANGRNVAASISEAEGSLSELTPLAQGAPIFSLVHVDGFRDAQKLQGSGSTRLVLAGSNALVTLTDDARTLLSIRALASTTIRYVPAAGVHPVSAARGLVDLRDDAGALVGTLAAVGAERAATPTFSLDESGILARVASGDEVVLLCGADDAIHARLADALSQGVPVASLATDAADTSQVAFGHITAQHALGPGSVVSDVTSPEGALLLYDLSYESLPARAAQDVAAYLDGALASPALVQTHEGRTQVLISLAAGTHRVSLQVGQGASTESQARAESKDSDGSRAYGSFELHDNGKLTGAFTSSIVKRDALQLWGYTDLSTQTELFRNLTVDGAAPAQSDAHDERYTSRGSYATLTLTDDAYATLTLHADAASLARLELGAGIRARQPSPRVVALDGPAGPAGALLLVGGSASHLHVADGIVEATLAQDATLVFRASPESYREDDAVAAAIAAGRIGAHIVSGLQEGAQGAVVTAFSPLVSAAADVGAQGSLAVSYVSGEALAQAFLVEARGATLAAKSAADVRVTVDGAPALVVDSVAAALATGDDARALVETSADGSVRVLVNTAAAAGHTSRVVVTSRLASAARQAASTDAFGTFHLFADGKAVGSFVTFQADDAAGAISGFTLLAADQPVFASLSAGASGFTGRGAEGASALVLENQEARIELSDTTSGFARIVAKTPTTAAFRLAADVRGEMRNAGVVELATRGGRDVGALILAGAGGFEQQADGQLRATLAEGSVILFKAHVGIETELSHAQRAMISDAIATGHIAGAVLVQTTDALSANARAALAAQDAAQSVALGAADEGAKGVTSAVTTSYTGDVQMVTAATQERVDITLSSESHLGRTILVSLDPRTVHGLATGDADILFDGAPAQEASSYADILDPTDDAGHAEYFVLAGDAGVQVLVSVPHFSVHTVTLKERTAVDNGPFMYATLALGVVVIAESILLYRRRNK